MKEQIIQLLSQYGRLSITENNNLISHITIDIDGYEAYDDLITIYSLNDDIVNIIYNNIIKIDNNIIYYGDFTLEILF